MPLPTEPKNHAVQLLQNLNISKLQQDKSFKDLTSLLQKSDVDTSALQILRTESETLLTKVTDRVKTVWERLQKALEPAAEKEYKVFRRETPILSTRIPASAPLWANGSKPAYSLGPYVGLDGRQFWYDFYQYEKLIPVYITGDTNPIMLVPVKLSIFSRPTTTFTITDGSIWMRADLFAAGLTNKQYAGVNVTKGTLVFQAPHSVVNNAINMASTEPFTLNITLNNTHTATGTGADGIDAREATITLPATAQFQFAAGKFKLAQMDNTSWNLYGDNRSFSYQQGAASFNPFLNRLVFPLLTDLAADFVVSSCKSEFFSIADKCKVLSAGWCLNVGTMDVAKPFAVGNNGAIGVLGLQGFLYKWKGLNVQGGEVKMGLPLIMAEPGKFSIADTAPQFKQHTEEYNLWLRDVTSGIYTSAELKLSNNAPFVYYCDEAGTEMISALADGNLLVDKPYLADGDSVSPKTKDSIYIKFTTVALKGMYLYDIDMVLEMSPAFTHLAKPDVYEFALHNAYLITTPPAGILLAAAYNETNTLTKGNLAITYGMFTLMPTLPHPYTTNALVANRAISVERLREVKDVKEWAQYLTNYVMSTCIWDAADTAAEDTVTVDFELLTDLFQQLKNAPVTTAPTAQTPNIQGTEQHDVHTLSGAFSSIQLQPKIQAVTENIIAVANPDLQASAAINVGAAAMQTTNPYAQYNPQLQEFMVRQQAYGRDNMMMGYALLDLSTNYDLFGVSLAFNSREYRSEVYSVAASSQANTVSIEKMNLQAPMAMLKAFTLPHISWEPLNNLSKPAISDDPVQGILSYPDNGIPTLFSQPDPKPVDIDPLQHLLRFRDNLAAEVKQQGTNIMFSLPNGKLSMALLSYFNPNEATVKKNFDFIQPAFTQNGTAINGGLQFRIASSKASGRHKMLGMTNQLRNVIYPDGVQQDISILGESVHGIFQNDFYKNFTTDAPEIKIDGVPVTHTDFSGYGASMFTDWLNPLAQIAQTSEVRFDVMVGRVSHEVVQVVSIVYPWGIKVVRTITFHRNANAVIYREDSGWVAQSDGLFDFSFTGEIPGGAKKDFPNPYSIHPGLIGGLFDVHNIVEQEEDPILINYTLGAGDYGFDSQLKQVIENPSGPARATFRAVTFDANTAIENIISAKTNGRVTGKSFKGYVQLTPPGVPVPPRVLAELFSRQQNLIGGTVDCIMEIGGSKQLLKTNRIDASASYQNDDTNNHIFVVAAKGSIQLPAEGSWSLVEVDKAGGDVVPVVNKESVPIIRRGERNRNSKNFDLVGNDKIVKVAYPDALVNNAGFAKRFGYLQNTGSQKMLLTDPRINQIMPASLLSEAPLLADAYRLLNSKGPFPNLSKGITIENVTEAVSDILPEGIAKKILNFSVPDNFNFDIIGKDGDTLHMYILYDSEPASGGKTKTLINYVTDSSVADMADKFKNDLKNLSVAVDMGPFKKLLTISGDFKAGSSIDPSMDSGNAPQLKLCKELQPIYEILEFLANLDPTNPVDAIKKALKVAMSNSADSWEYKFKADKEIPVVKFPFDPINYNSPTTPLKLDANFKIGCYYNQPIKIPNAIDQLMPSAGAFLELGADLRVMCFSLAAATVYATGRAMVGLAADIKSGPSLYFKFGFGIELCVGLPVIGSVSVMYLVGVDMKLTTEELTVGAFMYFKGRAEIFGGIVTITIQIEASGKIQKQLGGGPCNCIAMCTFAIDISICWIIDINFSETWEETRQIA